MACNRNKYKQGANNEFHWRIQASIISGSGCRWATSYQVLVLSMADGNIHGVRSKYTPHSNKTKYNELSSIIVPSGELNFTCIRELATIAEQNSRR